MAGEDGLTALIRLTVENRMTINELIDMGWIEITGYTPSEGGVQQMPVDSKTVYWLATKATTSEEFFALLYEHTNNKKLYVEPTRAVCDAFYKVCLEGM